MAELFDLDAVYAETRTEPFRFKWAGEEWELPLFADIDWRALGLANELTALADTENMAEVDVSVLRRLFEFAFGPTQAARWDKVPQNTSAMTTLFGAWQSYSGTTLGESSASTDSSASTERPSKPTSTGTTRSGSRRRSTAAKKTATAPASS